jgi:hypothetical protein
MSSGAVGAPSFSRAKRGHEVFSAALVRLALIPVSPSLLFKSGHAPGRPSLTVADSIDTEAPTHPSWLAVTPSKSRVIGESGGGRFRMRLDTPLTGFRRMTTPRGPGFPSSGRQPVPGGGHPIYPRGCDIDGKTRRETSEEGSLPRSRGHGRPCALAPQVPSGQVVGDGPPDQGWSP